MLAIPSAFERTLIYRIVSYRSTSVYLVRSTDGNVSVDGDEHRDPDGGGLRDECDRENVDEHELVERVVLIVLRVQSGVLDERRQKVQRERRHHQQVVNHRQSL